MQDMRALVAHVGEHAVIAGHAEQPSPTTSMPVTAPPRKATARAEERPLLAASAVRTLARTDTFMPM